MTQLSLDPLQHHTVSASQLKGYTLIYMEAIIGQQRDGQDLNDAIPPTAQNSEPDGSSSV